MQGFIHGFYQRSVVLIGVLLIAAAVSTAIGGPTPTTSPRWPTSDALYRVGTWSTGPETLEFANGATFVTRAFFRPDAAPTTLTVVTNTSPKLFLAGADVPFLGSGYEVSSLPAPGHYQALIASRGSSERWLVVYAYGERRGLLGNGPVAWCASVFDSVLARPNDYYKLYLTSALNNDDAAVAQQASELADALFPRIAGWYAAS
jgi:hypothetical protein